MVAFAGLTLGFDLDEVILKDIMHQKGSSQCTNGGNTDISFVHTPSPSYWDKTNADKEPKNFMAQMTHSESDPNRSWTVRFGKGGNIYSMIGGYGESIPPQTQGFSSWVDEVTQAVAVDISQNNCAISSECYYIHQSGTYFEDVDYLNETFYSPNVGKYCEGNTCIFATWGQIAKTPTIFKSDLLYVHQYRDCDNGVIEYTQLFVGYFGGQIAYLNMPWAGVRTSSLPDLYLSNLDSTMADKEDPIQLFNVETKMPELREMGGYSTFAQNQASDPLNNAALSYVHGIHEEYSDPSHNYFRAPSRIRFGKSGRDFTVFTVNGRITSTDSGNSFVHRQYLINDSLGNIASQAQPLIREAQGDMLTQADFSGRSLTVYSENSSLFGVAAASKLGGTSTTCSTGTVQCTGSTVPTSGHVPFFAIKCGSLNYFGADKYHFAPSPDSAGFNRAYVCDGQPVGVLPELKLLGFFPEDGSCGSLSSDAVYDSNFCDVTNNQCGPNEAKVELMVKTDGRGPETSYKIMTRNEKGKFKKRIMLQRKFPKRKVVKREKCISTDKCYVFRIVVKDRDGTCCAISDGWYRLTFDNVKVKSNAFNTLKHQRKKFGNC